MINFHYSTLNMTFSEITFTLLQLLNEISQIIIFQISKALEYLKKHIRAFAIPSLKTLLIVIIHEGHNSSHVFVSAYGTLRKIHQNTGSIWSTYSRIQTEYENIRANNPHIPIFSLNVGICGPDKTRILVYFTQVQRHYKLIYHLNTILNNFCIYGKKKLTCVPTTFSDLFIT